MQKTVTQFVITCDFVEQDEKAPRGVFRCGNVVTSEESQVQARLGAKLAGWHVCPASAPDVKLLVDLCPEHRRVRGL